MLKRLGFEASVTNLPYERQVSILGLPTCESKSGTHQTCGTPNADGRRAYNGSHDELKTWVTDSLSLFCFCLPRINHLVLGTVLDSKGWSGSRGSYAAGDLAAWNGIPNISSNIKPCSLVVAVVQIVMFIPCGLVYLSGLSSGKTSCSDKLKL